jgi:hypothetical protein
MQRVFPTKDMAEALARVEIVYYGQ